MSVDQDMSNPTEAANDPGRRRFLTQTGGAAAVTALAAGCIRKPVEHIMPYAKRPEDLIPGMPLYFATSMNVGAAVQGILVESHDGRPTKIEGNPGHPMNRGGTNTAAQVAAFDVYDSDRGKLPWFEGEESSWEAFENSLDGALGRWAETGGHGVAVLTQTTPSPTLARLLQELKGKLPHSSVYTYDPMYTGNAAAGAALVGDARLAPDFDLSQAKVIVTLDADIFGTDGDNVKAARQWADGRRNPAQSMNRMYSAEAVPTVTGASADHHLRIKSSRIEALLGAIATAAGANYNLPAGKLDAEQAKFAASVGADLLANKGAGAVVVGSRQPAHVHALAALLNQTLGNLGTTVQYRPEPGPAGGTVQDLGNRLLSGQVSSLIVLGGNPAYDGPAELGFDVLIKQVPLAIYLGWRRNETAEAADWYVPRAHFLESWGDLVASDGTASIQQPLIAPIYPSLSDVEFVARLAGHKKASGHDLVQATWIAVASGSSANLNAQADEADKTADAADKARVEAQNKLRAANGEGKAPGPAGQAPPTGEPAAADPVAAQPTAAPPIAAKPVAAKPVAVAPVAPGVEPGVAQPIAIDPTAAAVPIVPAVDTAKLAAIALATKLLESATARARTARSTADTARARVSQAAAAASAKFEKDWRKWVHDGVIHGSIAATVKPSFGAARLSAAWKPVADKGGLELNLFLSPTALDGRLTNIPWILELPDPITKLAWDNAAQLSPATAKTLGVQDGDMVSVSHAGRRMRAAAWVTKGMADDTVALTLGWGQKTGTGAAGHGFDAYPMHTSDHPWFGTGAAVAKGTGTYALAPLQDHQSMEGRPLVRQAPLKLYQDNPTFVSDVELFKDHPEKNATHLWTEPAMVGQQWGIAIDLNTCVGCNVCNIACSAENNIPVVGKDDCLNGRELHWMRLDRYFVGDDAAPEVFTQPMQCAQCETAPCENVCPVGATVHSPSGLNDMAYNRCIGTRYCANNCPYKVRRFNYFNYTKRMEEKWGMLLSMQRNPDVTVRFRGVIEKCSYCVQRINEGVIEAKRDGNGIVPDGRIVPACAQACPTNAITFGDVSDPASAVSLKKADNRNYIVLDEINIRPRTTYLARIKNTNKALQG
ncbi:MAG: Fe-S-cluster-containing dehydrogenase component/anaerobic selenocysteine-containing dehydrogenase [Myxococcota bacterium]|jgi:Fe-S-cluster-containing dehydrogenase component/anaerobic selenocysteine-containing dehydrogenase